MRPLPALWLFLWFVPALALAFAAVLNPSLIHHHLERTLQAATLFHPLGFDAFGKDLLQTTLRASVTSSLFASIATLLSIGLGVTAGTLMAVSPLGVRFTLQRGLETLLAFPALLFALAWAAVRGPGWDTLAVALLLGLVPSLTRLIYARTLEMMSEDYVTAARSLGASRIRVAFKHLAPGVFSLCRVKAPNLFASALMAEATLSFLGIGAPIGHETWGALLAQGKDYLIEAPHIALGSGLPLVLTILSLQVLSAGPKLRYDSE